MGSRQELKEDRGIHWEISADAGAKDCDEDA